MAAHLARCRGLEVIPVPAEWTRYGKRDQAALDRALYAAPLRLYVLNGVWNCITRYPDVRPENAAILHHPMSARRWMGIINGRLDGPEARRKADEWEAVHPEWKKP